jgi:hypothetical protein
MRLKQPFFPYRANADGSFNSICPTCYVTVAESKLKSELAELGAAHRCDQAFLKRNAFALAKCAQRHPAL